MDIFKRQNSLFTGGSDTRAIRVFRNGDHSRYVELSLKSSTTFADLRGEIIHKLGLKDTGVFRLYTSEGIELYEDYIPLIRDDDRLYASQGEEFDQSTSLAGFREISVLGQGGFGKVLLMEEMHTGDLYAVKYVDARKYGLASLIDMVFKEAELLKSLNHRHIVQIVNFFALKDMRIIFVMEYLEGGELGEYLKKKGKLEEEEALVIFRQLVDAVYFCHLNNIIHRDLKLENILFESKDTTTIKVVDFGIAGFYSGMKGSESNAGSLRYMAPEVLNGKNTAANPAIDVWSMGVILYVLLHGYLPFNGSSRKEILEKIVEGRYDIALEIKKKASPECLDLLKRMLTVDPKARISSFEISNHHWIVGEKNPFLQTWEEIETEKQRLAALKEEELMAKKMEKRKMNRALIGQLSQTPTAKGSVPRGSFNILDKETTPKGNRFEFQRGFHRKANSRDQSVGKEFLNVREMRPSLFGEGVRGNFGHKRLQTISDIKIKEESPLLPRATTPKKTTILPPISVGLWSSNGKPLSLNKSPKTPITPRTPRTTKTFIISESKKNPMDRKAA